MRLAPGGAKSWVIRYRDQAGKSREMNLGRSDKISLELARKKASHALANLLDGEDPLKEREARREAARTSGERALQTVVESTEHRPCTSPNETRHVVDMTTA